MFFLELAIVLACIYFGARLGGVGLGTAAGVGLAIQVFVLRQKPGELPVDVILIIGSVITAAAALQAAGGLDFMVRIAEGILRARPQAITFVAPAVSWVFTFFAGTGHVAYTLLPVIAETARKAGVRPERPLGISVIASQQAITASPISAATAAMIALLAVNDTGLGLGDILLVCVPSTLAGSMLGALATSRVGKELKDDPVYQERLAKGLIDAPKPEAEGAAAAAPAPGAKLSVLLFGLAVITVVVLGILSAARPVTGWKASVPVPSVRLVDGEPRAFVVDPQTQAPAWKKVSASLARSKGWVDVEGLSEGVGIVVLKEAADADRLTAGDTAGFAERIAAGTLKVTRASPTRLSMAPTIEIVMLCAAGLMMILCKVDSDVLVKGSVARAGAVAAVAILGIAWLGSTFFENNRDFIVGGLAGTIQSMPWTFSLALFVLSILLYSQAATVAALMAVGLQLGIQPKYLIAMFPAVNGYFFLPTYGTIVAAIEFDQTGTTGVGKYLLNHSFMLPGLVATCGAVGIGFLLAATVL